MRKPTHPARLGQMKISHIDKLAGERSYWKDRAKNLERIAREQEAELFKLREALGLQICGDLP